MLFFEDEDFVVLFCVVIGEVMLLCKDVELVFVVFWLKLCVCMVECDEVDVVGEFVWLLCDSMLLEVGDVVSYCCDNLLLCLFQCFKCGQYLVQDELDLYGVIVVQVEVLLCQFLLEVYVYEYGCVCIIYGKGLQFDGGVLVLKNLVDCLLWLCNDVLVFYLVLIG